MPNIYRNKLSLENIRAQLPLTNLGLTENFCFLLLLLCNNVSFSAEKKTKFNLSKG